MPAQTMSEIQGPTLLSISILPSVNSGVPKRPTPSGLRGVDKSTIPTTAGSKLISSFNPPPATRGKLYASILPDLRQPPPFHKSDRICLPPTSIGSTSLTQQRFSHLPDNPIVASVLDLIPSIPVPQILCVDVGCPLKSGQGRNRQMDQQAEVGKHPGTSSTPDLLKMSPCLRPDSSPCADDLGNYAMHVSQMELVWHGEFDRLFTQYYPHAWYLVPTFYPPSDRWRVFKDSAKVRFSCQECGHGWTSMKGRVIFWFHLNYATNSGYVMFKLYGQQCQKCKNGSYEHAMWYPEEVVKVIGNVYNRVGQVFYGFVRPPLRIDRRQGKPRNQHNADLCQACKEGLCKEEWSFS